MEDGRRVGERIEKEDTKVERGGERADSENPRWTAGEQQYRNREGEIDSRDVLIKLESYSLVIYLAFYLSVYLSTGYRGRCSIVDDL